MERHGKEGCPTPWTRGGILASAPTLRSPTCRSCGNKIDHFRIGVIHNHCDGYIRIQWFHMYCVDPPCNLTVAEIEGFNDADMKPYRRDIFQWLSMRVKSSKSTYQSPQKDAIQQNPSMRSMETSQILLRKPPLAPVRRNTPKNLNNGIHGSKHVDPSTSTQRMANELAQSMKSCLPDTLYPMMMS